MINNDTAIYIHEYIYLQIHIYELLYWFSKRLCNARKASYKLQFLYNIIQHSHIYLFDRAENV